MLEGFEPEPERPSKKRTPKAVKPVANSGGLNNESSSSAPKRSRTVPTPSSASMPRPVVDTWPAPAESPPPGITPDLGGKTVVVIDSHSLIYQLFHAMTPMSSPAGFPVSTVYGFLRDVADLRQRLEPAYMWAAFDMSELTFRSEIYKEYKAHREAMPDELRLQIPLIRRGLEALGVGLIGVPGFEADDVLATLAVQVRAGDGRCVLVTADKDCRQLLNDHVSIYNIRKDELFGPEELKAVWGIRPDQVVDFQSLVGDSVDNIPGVPLIGPKLAEQLLREFGTLENVLANPDKVSGQKRQENLRNFRDQALISRELVRLRSDVPLELDWGSANFSRKNVEVLDALFKELGLRRLSERLLGKDPVVEMAPMVWETNYQCITTSVQLQTLVKQLAASTLIAFDTETTSTNPRDSRPVGYSFAWGPGQAAYVPLLAPAHEKILSTQEINSAIAPIMADPLIRKVGQNIKFDLVVLRTQGIAVSGLLCDTMVADYLLDPANAIIRSTTSPNDG